MIIEPVKRLSGEIALPGDKSISHRAIMIGSIAKGDTSIKGLLDCDDCNYTIRAFREMGIDIEKNNGLTIVKGKGLHGLKKPARPINVGNSGTTMRLLAGILAGQDFETTLTGEESLLNRPMKRIVEPLSKMGVNIKAAANEYPPLTIKGGSVKAVDYKMPVSSAQVKSTILFAGLYADGITRVTEDFKSRDHTERMLAYYGADVKVEGLNISLKGLKELTARDVEVPGDISSASFFIIAAILLGGSKIKIKGVNVNPTRAGILDVLSRMGARIRILNRKETFEPVGDIEVESGKTCGIVINEEEIPAIIDELPILFVLASLSKGRTVIKGAEELRVKETDRINSMKENLSKMGADIRLEKNDVIIEGRDKLKCADLKSFGDHRTCMAATIASLAAKGKAAIDDVECVSKSFPDFFQILKRMGS